jgi:hypothetical protein
MGKMDDREKNLCRLRDLGIWIVAILLIANFLLWNAHDRQVKYKVEPAIEQNTIQIEKNSMRLDSIAKAADSVFNTINKHLLKDK